MSAALVDLRLTQIRLEAEGIASYEFVHAANDELPPFTAGAHIDLHLPQDMVRSYSLVNPPSDRERYVIAVQHERDGRGGSAWLHASPRVGDVLRASAPDNAFALAETAPHSVFIAGGIGITPVMSMLRQLGALGRRWHLHYAGRSPQQSAYVDALRAMGSGTGRVDFCFGSDGPQRLDIARIVRDAPDGSHLYCCGPARMIDGFVAACASLPADRVHYERFGAGSDAATEGGYEIVLHRSGRRLAVDPGKTILDTLIDHSIDVPYACSAGVCGTCRTAVLQGEPDHRDGFLSPEEREANDSMMICCSGARSDTLVLDL